MSESRASIPPASEWRYFNREATLADLFGIDGEGRTPRQACSLKDIQGVFGQPFDPRLIDQLGLETPWYFCSPEEYLPMVFASTGQAEPGFFSLSAATHLVEIGRSAAQGVTTDGLRIAAVERTTGRPVGISYSKKFPIGVFNTVVIPRFHITTLSIGMTEEEALLIDESVCLKLPTNTYLLRYGTFPAITHAMLAKSRLATASGRCLGLSMETEFDPEKNLRMIFHGLKGVRQLPGKFTIFETPDEVKVVRTEENGQNIWELSPPRHLVPAA